VGLKELSLIWDAGMRRFPPRLPQQPIFYPVANIDYARQIARDWNARDEGSGFAGFVTRFAVDGRFLARFEPHTVGSFMHVEHWIPAEDLHAFNLAIAGRIAVEEGFFGPRFSGELPDGGNWQGKDAAAQFAALWHLWQHRRGDLAQEISVNRKAVFLNWLFWERHDFSPAGINEEDKNALLTELQRCWERDGTGTPLPAGNRPDGQQAAG